MKTTFTLSTPTGKIARLPRALRDQLNERLDHGQSGPDLLAWLNDHPDAQPVIAESGSPINAQNLTNWRQGGYQLWLRVQERLLLARDLMEQADDMEPHHSGPESLTNHLTVLLVSEFAAALVQLLPTLTDPAQRCDYIAKYLNILARLRQQDYQAGRLDIQRQRRFREADQENQADLQAASDRRLADYLFQNEINHIFPHTATATSPAPIKVNQASATPTTPPPQPAPPTPPPQPTPSPTATATSSSPDPIKVNQASAVHSQNQNDPPLASDALERAQSNATSRCLHSGDRHGVQTKSGTSSAREFSTLIGGSECLNWGA